MNENPALTNAEWNVMECLWERSPRTAMEAVHHLKKSVGWAKSTTLTMLRRMTEKGLINCEDDGRAKHYSPAVERGFAASRETQDFLNRVYKGSVSIMMSAMTSRDELSKEEIDRLNEILRNAEENADA